jgi:uncharacterized Zn finger protein
MNENHPYGGCPQCGAHELKRDGDFVRCSYCNAVYEVIPEPPGEAPKVIIGKGAHVIIGKNANVVIRGGVKIEPGADVDVEGRLRLVRKGEKDPPADD